MGDRWVQLLGYQLGVGELSKVEGVSYKELGVSESDRFICEGVGEGGGAGSAQRLVEGCGCGDDCEFVGVRERRISEGVGVGGGAGSAQSLSSVVVVSWSCGVVGVLVVVGVLGVIGSGSGELIVKVVLEVAMVGVEVVGMEVDVVDGLSRRCFTSRRRLRFAC